MTGREQRAGELRRLHAALESDLAAVTRISLAVEEARAVSDVPSPLEQAGIALHLHHFYTACEEALLRVARVIDRSDYSGGGWHRELLAAMSRPVAGMRDAVVSDDTVRLLDPYRGFRHVVRHAYEYELDWERTEPLARRLPRVSAAFATDLTRFLDHLLDRATELDPSGE